MNLKKILPRPLFVLKFNKPVVAMLALAILYMGFSITSFLYPNPFLVATEQAQKFGNWEPEQVQFRRGRYQYRPFGSVVEADLRVLTPSETFSVHIELSHSLLSGWTVYDFHNRGESVHPCPAANCQ